MKSIKICLLVFLLIGNVWAKDEEKITLNFNNTPVEDVIKFVATTLDTNILISERLSGNVNFLSNKPINKSELLPFLRQVLSVKGFTVVQNDSGYLEIVKSSRAKNSASLSKSSNGMVTSIIEVKNTKASSLVPKINHLSDTNGILNADDVKNQLFVVDYKNNIKKLRQLAYKLDSNTQKKTIYVTLENHFAVDAFKPLDAILKSKSSEFVAPVQIILMESSNTIVAICDVRDAFEVENTIKQFDIKNPKMAIFTDVISVNNAKAVELYKVLDVMIKAMKTESTISIAAKEDINAIAVSGNKEQIQMVRNIVQQLDKAQKQIFLSTEIYEISQNDMEALGIKWGVSGGYIDDTSIYTGNLNLGGSVWALDKVLSENVTIKSEQNKGLAIGAMFDMLKTNGVVNTISEPTLMAVNNIKSSIYVGKTKSIMTSSATGDNADDVTRNNFTREDIGLTLEVTPQIAEDNKVVLDILVQTEDIDASDSENADRPTTTKREIKTTSVVMNEQSVVVGGLMKDYYSKTKSKVPLLGDIPFLGMLFRSTNESFDKLNLVVVVTPYIINSANEVYAIQEKIAQLDKLKKELAKEFEESIKKTIKQNNENTKKISDGN